MAIPTVCLPTLTRSIAIDALTEQAKNPNSKVVYLYFDYATPQNQTAMSVARSLLKQLVSQSGDFPFDLESLYDNAVQHGTEPDIDTLILHLSLFAEKNPVYAIFDAIDECDLIHIESLLEFFSELQQSAFRLLISTRPHLQNFEDHLWGLRNLEIVADENDLKNYITIILKKEKNVNATLESKCLDLAKDVQGM